ncbi:MAG: hypothetical protein SFU91_01435 [Chloroherpetonaceae bacterium]|nr:hypothetical protein [Chloroherpetonaceae bacterium]
MGKRQIIIKPQEATTKLVGEEVNIETTELRVWHGYVTSINQNELKFRDTRQKIHTLKMSDVRRIFAERVTEY